MNTICMNRSSSASALLLLAFFIVAGSAHAQYYYKDVIVTGQISATYQLLKNNKVNSITVTPAELDPSQNNVTLKQTVYPSQNLVVTYSKVPDATESWLKSYYDSKGTLIKTVDSSASFVTSSSYGYDAAGRVAVITSNAVPINDPAEKEVHSWTYNSNGQPTQMIKIKDNIDTTIVSFVADEQGNAGEEKAIHKKNSQGSIYYYYDAQHRLTDVAKFNARANRILPQYMFEYNDAAQVTQMIVVPEGSADYQTWKYNYNPQGLKVKDICYSKQKQLVASIDYTYSFGK